MSEHDPICPHQDFIPGDGVWIDGFTHPPEPVQRYEPCQCDLIARARADERAKFAHNLKEWRDRWRDIENRSRAHKEGALEAIGYLWLRWCR